MNRLTTEKRATILASLCEGASVNATSRITGASKVTILKLLADIGQVCLGYQRETLTEVSRKMREALDPTLARWSPVSAQALAPNTRNRPQNSREEKVLFFSSQSTVRAGTSCPVRRSPFTIQFQYPNTESVSENGISVGFLQDRGLQPTKTAPMFLKRI